MAAKIQTAGRLSDLLAESGPLDDRHALEILKQLTSQLAALHATGKLAPPIRADRITIDSGNTSLIDRESSAAVDLDEDLLPPEIGRQRLPQIPERIDEAQAALRSAGIDIDPRRIDIYGLGCLTCQMLTGSSPQSYLFSPRSKARIAPAWRRVLDGMLGFDPAARINSCDQLQAELVQIASTPQPTSSETPPRGTGIDALTNTPRTPHPVAQPLPFQTLGHYQLVARLGSGGMGDVYRGYDPQLERTVALKVLPLELARQPDFIRRFVDEAKAAASLIHPNIVQIFTIGEEAGHHYFAMQFVAGETLAARMTREKRLSLDRTLTIIDQLLSGLSIAHRQGMIHRDIKPGNILLDTEHDRALLADFGLVKSLDSSEQMTATGMVMGTVDYISPEQGRGHKVDTRSDLYSVGVLMYQMLSGRIPFVAESATAMIFQHAYEKPRPLEDYLPDVAPGAIAIVARLMAKNPADRYQTAEDLLVDVRALRAEPTWQPASAIDVATDSNKSIIIEAPSPDFVDDDRRLTVALAPLPRPRWQDRLRVLFHLHAPTLLQNLQNTEQQVDGALAVYQDRRDKLAQLVNEALGLERVFAEQGLTNELRHQQGEREEIQLRLAKADATLQKLRSQQLLLKARLRAVEARQVISAPTASRSRFRITFARLAALVFALPFISTIIYMMMRSNETPPVKTIEPSTLKIEILVADIIGPPSGRVNLLPYIDLRKDTVGGIWTTRGSAVHVANQPGTIPARTKYLKIPLVIHGSYEFRFKYTIGKNRSRGVSVRLPMGTSRGVLLIGQSRKDEGLGINGIRGLASNDPANPTAHPDFANPTDVERDAFIRVENGPAGAVHATVAIDGKQLIDWSGNQSEVSIRDSDTGKTLPQDPLLILGAWGMGATFREPTLRMLDGLATRLPESERNAPQASNDSTNSPDLAAQVGVIVPLTDWFNLTPLIDLGRDAIGSTWSLADQAIRFTNPPGTNHMNVRYLKIPLLVNGSYDLRFKYTIAGDSRSRGLNVRFPIGNARAALVIGKINSKSGIGINGVKGLDAFDSVNPTSDSNFPIPLEDEREAVVRVESSSGGQAHVVVTTTGHKQIDWSGNESEIRVFDSVAGSRLPMGPTIILGSWGNGVTFRDLSLRMLTGSAEAITAEATSASVPATADQPILAPIAAEVPQPGSPLDILTSPDWEWSKPVNAGPVLNTGKNEGSPFLSADGLTLLFDSTRDDGVGGTDIYMSERTTVNDPWRPPVNLGPTINSDDNDYHLTMTADGLTLVFSSARPGGIGAADLYMSTRPNKSAPWGPLTNLGRPINSNLNERGSCISPDGLSLIVGTDRPGGVGRNDLWIIRRKSPTDHWGRISNLGTLVNSNLADKGPNLSADGLVLVFQSDRAGGFGSYDNWMSTRPSLDEPFGQAVNLGPIVNSSDYDDAPAVSADGKTIWFGSNRPGGQGGHDLWYSQRVKRTAK